MQTRRTLSQWLTDIRHSAVALLRQAALETAMYCADLEATATERRLGGAHEIGLGDDEPPRAEPSLAEPVAVVLAEPVVVVTVAVRQPTEAVPV